MRDWRNNFMTPSNIDMFNQYLTGYQYESYGDNEAPEFTTELFVNRLLRLEAGSKNMEAGTAVHKLLENMVNHKSLGVAFPIQVNGWNIDCKSDIEIPDLPLVAEQKVEFKINDDLSIWGKIDGAYSHAILDNKTTSSSIDIEKYIETWQWKVYLLATGYRKFIYDIYKIGISTAKHKYITINEYKRFTLYAYENMEQEVRNFINDYCSFLDNIKPMLIKVATDNQSIIKASTLKTLNIIGG